METSAIGAGPSAGLVLALDSCGAETTLALLCESGGEPEVMRQDKLAPRTAAAHLLPAIRALLDTVSLAELRAMIVVRGPGSFTGMRIGLSTAKALAEAAGVPIVAVSRLAVLAGAVRTQAVALDAGKGRLYLGLRSSAEAELSEGLFDLQETGQAIAGREVVVCESRVISLLPQARLVAAPTAVDAARHGWPRLLRADWEDPATLDAHYLWRAEQMLRTGVIA